MCAARAAASSPAWRLAQLQATEMRRRKSRESARAAERLWLALVLEALDDGLPVRSVPAGESGADLDARLGVGMRGAHGA